MEFSTTADYYRLSWVGNGDLTQDGTLLAYARTHVDEPATEVNEVVLRDFATGSERVIARGFDPAFSPDGTRLLYTRSDNGVDQLFVYDLAHNEETQLTEVRFGVEQAAWSPTGDRIAFVSRVDLSVDESLWAHGASEAELDTARKQAVEHPYVSFEGWAYKSDEDGGFSCERASTLWSVPACGGEPVLLSNGRRDHVMPTFTPDGQSIVFVSNRCRSEEEGIAMDLFRVPAAGGAIERLTDSSYVAYYPAPFQPLVTPDGREVVFGALAPNVSESSMPPTRLFKVALPEGVAGVDADVDTAASGADAEKPLPKPVCLWPEDAPCHEATCFLYNCENLGVGTRRTAAFSTDGSWLYFISGWHGAANLYRASLMEPRIEPVTQGLGCMRSIAVRSDRVLVSRGDFTHTPQLMVADEADLLNRGLDAFAPLTASNEWLEGTLVEPRELWIDSLDGEAHVQGFVFEPQNREEGKRYPAVVYLHGGPTPFMGAALTYEHQCILGAGMGLIVMNFRGSSGYGPAHQSVAKAYDGSAMTDVLQFVDAACREFDWIDPDRLGVTGGSYGGWLTNWLCGHTKRFKAAVTQRSIANELIQYASSDMLGSSHGWESFSDYMADALKRSPVSYAEKIDVPFLILHGMADMRCPVENAHQLFCAVRETHPEGHVRMVLFPGMTHSFPMGGPMDLRRAHYDAMIEWFKEYL